MKTVDKYLFQALDNYPYSLEDTIESLDYALAYNDKNVMALCLYGRVHTEQLQDYEEAKRFFQEALAINVFAVVVYPFYIETLLLNDDLDEAARLIEFALTLKGTDKATLMLRKVTLLEKQKDIKGALELLKQVRLSAVNNDSTYQIDEAEKRLKAKQELLVPKDKEKSKKEKDDKAKKKKRK